MTPIQWLFDRTGFAYYSVPAARIAVAVLPLTKAQIELWLADPEGPGDDWYADLVKVGPRFGWRAPGRFAVSQLLLTGLNPEEAGFFAAWLGAGYRLPTTAEWRASDRALGSLPLAQLQVLIDDPRLHPAAAGILRKLAESGRRTSMGLSLLEGGVLEWVVRPSPPHGGLGRPLAGPSTPPLISNRDPQAFDPVTMIRPGRYPAFGARLVRPLDLDAAL